MTSTNIIDNNNEHQLPVSTPQKNTSTLSPNEIDNITQKGSIQKRGITPRNTTFDNTMSPGSMKFIDIISKEGEEYKPNKTISKLGLCTVLDNSIRGASPLFFLIFKVCRISLPNIL